MIERDFYTRTSCRLCDSERLALELDLGATPLANELGGTDLFPLKVMSCGECGHHQLSIAVSPERLWGPNYPYQSGTSPVFRKHLEALADEVARLKPGGRVLEIASNDGSFLRALHARGIDSTGIDPCADPSRKIPMEVEYSADKMTAKKINTYLDEIRDSWTSYSAWDHWFGRGIRFDVIVALNVFAHVDDLNDFTAGVKHTLAPDGVFILEMGHAPAVADLGYFDTIYHEHMSYHSTGALARFLSKHGLSIYQASYNRSQGGSKRYYITHRKADDFSSDWERTRDTPGFRKLADVIQSSAYRLGEALNGKRVAVYGAPAKLTTLMYATGPWPCVVECVGDDNQLKVGKTTPGLRIPIVSVDEMLARRPEVVVVAAWNFFDDMRDKLRRAGFGGDIINPMQGAQ